MYGEIASRAKSLRFCRDENQTKFRDTSFLQIPYIYIYMKGMIHRYIFISKSIYYQWLGKTQTPKRGTASLPNALR